MDPLKPHIYTNLQIKTQIIIESIIKELKEEYKAVFKTLPRPSPRQWDHRIDTGNSEPIRIRLYQTSPLQLQVIKNFIQDGLKGGLYNPQSHREVLLCFSFQRKTINIGYALITEP